VSGIDLAKSKVMVLEGCTVPEGLRPLDVAYLEELLEATGLFELPEDTRVDRIEVASDSEDLGIYVWTSQFVQVGHWLAQTYLQIECKLHLYSEHGQDPDDDDHDPYMVPVGPITYKEVALPKHWMRSCINDPGRG
jgi:hypothetical protein